MSNQPEPAEPTLDLPPAHKLVVEEVQTNSRVVATALTVLGRSFTVNMDLPSESIFLRLLSPCCHSLWRYVDPDSWQFEAELTRCHYCRQCGSKFSFDENQAPLFEPPLARLSEFIDGWIHPYSDIWDNVTAQQELEAFVEKIAESYRTHSRPLQLRRGGDGNTVLEDLLESFRREAELVELPPLL